MGFVGQGDLTAQREDSDLAAVATSSSSTLTVICGSAWGDGWLETGRTLVLDSGRLGTPGSLSLEYL